MSKLLIQESPLTFQPSLAVAIGLNEAIVLQQVHYWISNSRNKGYEQDGYKWVYNTYAEWKETNFPFWSENTVQRTFASLEEKGLVISIQPMKSKYDRTKYYRIDYPKLEAFEDTKTDVIDDPKLVCSLNESENTAENTQPDFYLSSQDLAEVNQKVDFIIANSNPSAWKGREMVRDNLLPLADWYHNATGQVMTKRVQKAWYKALQDWQDEGITPAHLQVAFEAQSKWRMVSDPNWLTKDAAAVKAAGSAKDITSTLEFDADGTPASY